MTAKRVVIAGGGVIGAWSAFFLAKAGHPVTIIDRGRFGAACSHGNCGYISPSHVLPLAQPGAVRNSLATFFHSQSALKIRWGQAIGSFGWFWNFMRRCNGADMRAAAVGITALLNSSRQLYEELIAGESLDVDWQPHGCLFTFQTKAGFEHFAEVNRLLSEEFQAPARRIEAAELEAMEPALKPGVCAGAWHYERDAQLRPERLMTELRRVLTAQGVTIVENAAVTDVRGQGNRATAVVTAQGEYPTDAFILATGSWTPQLKTLMGARVPIIPGKGYSITMPRPAICPKYPIIFEEHHVAVSPFADGYRIGSTMEFAGYDERTDPNRLAILREAARIYLKTPFAEPTMEEWWGWRPMIYDGKPIIDRTPAWTNGFIAAGHGMLGVSMGPATGRLLSELVSDAKPHVDPGAYALSRFT